jgi:uncharacterized membrane protein YeaQ/YmgE (transglycosylase-associated protein family)
MEITIGNVIGWLVAGILAGSLTGVVVKRSRQGFGHLANIGIGLIGALIGGSLFQILNISIGNLADISVSLQDLVSAFIGSLIFLFIVWLIRRKLQKQEGEQA